VRNSTEPQRPEPPLEALASILQTEISVLGLALIALVGYRLLTGSTRTTGLVSGDKTTKETSPGRVQLLLLAPFLAMAAASETFFANYRNGDVPLPEQDVAQFHVRPRDQP
jgi:hypothetical protein